MSLAKRCTSCNAPVLLALVKRRDGGASWMPLDLKPDMRGNVAVTKDKHGTPHGRILKGDDGCEPGETRYQTHFKSCPNAGAHRRRDQPAEPQDPETLLKIARKEHAQVQRIAATHHATCPKPGCGECKRLGAHIHRTERQIALLTPQVEAPQESLF